MRKELNDANIIEYLKSTEGEILEMAKEYVQKAPEQINTELRQRIKTGIELVTDYLKNCVYRI